MEHLYISSQMCILLLLYKKARNALVLRRYVEGFYFVYTQQTTVSNICSLWSGAVHPELLFMRKKCYLAWSIILESFINEYVVTVAT